MVEMVKNREAHDMNDTTPTREDIKQALFLRHA